MKMQCLFSLLLFPLLLGGVSAQTGRPIGAYANAPLSAVRIPDSVEMGQVTFIDLLLQGKVLKQPDVVQFVWLSEDELAIIFLYENRDRCVGYKVSKKENELEKIDSRFVRFSVTSSAHAEGGRSVYTSKFELDFASLEGVTIAVDCKAKHRFSKGAEDVSWTLRLKPSLTESEISRPEKYVLLGGPHSDKTKQ